MTAPRKYCRRKPRSITKGLPQDGILSPCLWLATSNQMSQELRIKRDLNHIEGEERKDILFAETEYVTTFISAPPQKKLSRAAPMNTQHIEEILAKMQLQLSIPKCENVVLNPNILLMDIFRRKSKTKYPPTATRLRKQYTGKAKHSRQPPDYDPLLLAETCPEQHREQNNYPFPLSESLRVLGVTIGTHFALDAHFKNM